MIRVGINASYAPFETVDDVGHLSGFDIDLVKAWAKNQGVQVKFVNLTWPRLLDSLTEGQVDMAVSAIAVTPERRQRFDLSRPYYYEPQVLLLPSGERREDPRVLTTIGILTGSSALGWLARLGVHSDSIQQYEGVPPMMAALRTGDLQAAFLATCTRCKALRPWTRHCALCTNRHSVRMPMYSWCAKATTHCSTRPIAAWPRWMPPASLRA